MYIWDTANDLIKQSLPVAGEVVSLDTWTDCLAVGSEVVQIIQLSDLKRKESKRTIYAKKGELMPVCDIVANHRGIVSFFFFLYRKARPQNIWLLLLEVKVI